MLVNMAVDCMMDGPMGHVNNAVDSMMDGPMGHVRSLLSPWYSADPRTPIFWCIWLHHSARNDAESGSFSRGSVEFTRTVPCSLIFAWTRTVFRPCSPCADRLGLQNILATCCKIAPPQRIEPMDYSTIT